MQITGTVIVGGSMYAEWFKLEPVFEIASLLLCIVGLYLTTFLLMSTVDA